MLSTELRSSKGCGDNSEKHNEELHVEFLGFHGAKDKQKLNIFGLRCKLLYQRKRSKKAEDLVREFKLCSSINLARLSYRLSSIHFGKLELVETSQF